MLKFCNSRSIFLIIFFLVSSESILKADENSIVVFDFAVSEDLPPDLKDTLTGSFIEELRKTGNFEITEVSKRNQILSKLGTQLSIIMDPEKRRKAGELLGVGKIFAGSVWKVGEITHSAVQIFDGETGRLETTIKIGCKCNPDELHEKVKVLARRIAGLPDDWVPEGEKQPQEVKNIETEREILAIKLEKYEEERKSTGTAFFLSFLLGFGAGNFYSDNPKVGLAFALLETGSIILMSLAEDTSVGLYAFLAFRQLDWIFAIRSTVRYNQALREKIIRGGLFPYISTAGNTPVYGFGVKF